MSKWDAYVLSNLRMRVRRWAHEECIDCRAHSPDFKRCAKCRRKQARAARRRRARQ